MSNVRKVSSMLAGALLLSGMLAGCGNSNNNESASTNTGNKAGTSNETVSNAADEKVTISLLTDNSQEAVNASKALIEAFEAKYPNITVESETRPSGAEGDNFVKTRLATGDMNDVFFYNSGSQMQTLNPSQNFLDITSEPFMDNVIDSFKTTVSFEGKVYGVPNGSTYSGGWFYNKKVYSDLGLSVPKTWADLMANNEKIKAAGIVPVIGTYKDNWTAQMIVLADYYNLQLDNPTFAEDYTANKAKFATTPAALRGFEKLQEVYDKGYMNSDSLATTYDAGIAMLAEGKGAHYPMLTFAVPVFEQNFPDQLQDIGFFAQPGDDASKNGLTVWMPGGAFIYKNSEHTEQAKLFLEFMTTPEGLAAWGSQSKPTGPWGIKGAALPDNVAPVVRDMLPYFDANITAPALEFLSPVKGPNLPQIATEVGSGIKNAQQGAEEYDKDVKKQAQQLGLEGW
ncbi:MULTISPECIES: ABC transporter substrate-binding protein [Paenibacillus]|uniref:ABC transporter substrate-binding protein n=1 Tax=Paenibacillus TaxID=44249 RepID=UPI00096FFCCD|nr:extracellular solute-binding protein [Paenibacillus odorifer]OME08679.1 ABC transporter substrate-binding protein [Paenibacillus odorifer]